MRSIRDARLLLLFEAATFIMASAIHVGALLGGYEHTKAGTAEAVIAAALLSGLALTWRPSIGLRAFVGAQVFATFGVLVGLFTIAVGVGPRTVLDVAYHVFILAVLVGGLAFALRERPGLR